jgi:hypothetical protein
LRAHGRYSQEQGGDCAGLVRITERHACHARAEESDQQEEFRPQAAGQRNARAFSLTMHEHRDAYGRKKKTRYSEPSGQGARLGFDQLHSNKNKTSRQLRDECAKQRQVGAAIDEAGDKAQQHRDRRGYRNGWLSDVHAHHPDKFRSSAAELVLLIGAIAGVLLFSLLRPNSRIGDAEAVRLNVGLKQVRGLFQVAAVFEKTPRSADARVQNKI